jgi:hypothetical protein
MISCLAYSSTLKIQATCYSETSVDFQRTTRRYIPNDRTLLNHFCENLKSYIFSNQLVNPATSSPADDVHHDVIPPKLLLTNRFYFQQTSSIHEPVGKRKGCSLSGRIPAPIADSSNVATIERKHNVLNLRTINRNNTHTALASGLTYYGWVSLIC